MMRLPLLPPLMALTAALAGAAVIDAKFSAASQAGAGLGIRVSGEFLHAAAASACLSLTVAAALFDMRA